MANRKEDPSVFKIFIIIALIGGAVLGVAKLYGYLSDSFIPSTIEAAAPDRLDRARALFEQGAEAEAREELAPIVSRLENSTFTPKALALLAEMEEANGDVTAALAHLERAVKEFPNSSEYAKLADRYGRLLEQQERYAEAVSVYEEIRDNAPAELRAPALLGLGRHAERQNAPIKARNLYRQAVRDAEPDSPVWNEALDALGRVNVELVFSQSANEESKIYKVEAGDSLTTIGIALNTTQGMLMRANGITDPSLLRVGQLLKYTPKDFRIVIERSKCRLFLFDADGVFKRYSVGLGMPGHETSLGTYRIGTKQKDPTWFKPGSEPIPPGDPRNELGPRWMPLVPEREEFPSDLGIHGTIAPETIGEFASHGCARMLNEDAIELYDLVVRSTPVEIVETLDKDLL